MYATFQARLKDKKEKARQASLRWLFSDPAGETSVWRISDKRDAGVYPSMNQRTAGKPGSDRTKNQGDSLPGFLTLDFLTGGLLSLAFHGVTLTPLAEAASDFWPTRKIPSAPPVEFSYFPL